MDDDDDVSIPLQSQLSRVYVYSEAMLTVMCLLPGARGNVASSVTTAGDATQLRHRVVMNSSSEKPKLLEQQQQQ